MVRAFEDIGSVKSFDEIGSSSIYEQPPRVKAFEDIDIDKVGFIEAITERPIEKIPFVGGAAKVNVLLSTMNAADRLKADRYEELPKFTGVPAVGIPFKIPSDISKEKDIKLIENYLKDLDKQYTFGGKVGQITSEMPAFMIEFLATGGLAKIGDKAARKVGTKLLGRYVTTTAGKAAIGTGAFATKTAFRASGMPHRATEAILRRQAPKDLTIKDNGSIEVVEPGEAPLTSVWKGLADHYIEIASEQAGEFIAPSVNKLFAKLPLMGKLTSKLQSKWLSLNKGKTAADFLKKISTKTGFHGVLSEVGEEYLGDITRAIVDVDDFGAGEDAGILDRISAGVQRDTENLPAMLIAFSIPGIGTQAISKLQSHQIKQNEILVDELKRVSQVLESTPTQIEAAEGTLGYEDDFLFEKLDSINQVPQQLQEPGLFKTFTPKWLVNRMLGIETLLEDVDKAELSRQLEQQHLNTWINKTIKGLKKEKELRRLAGLLPSIAEVERERVEIGETLETAEGSLGEDFYVTKEEIEKTPSYRLYQKLDSKNPIYIMRDLLDTYEDAPTFLNENETRIFNQIRELTRYLRKRANLVREKQGLEPIQEVKAYITHWMDAAAQRVVNKDVPAHSGYLYYLMKNLPKTIKNPTAQQRKVRGYMEKYFSKDLGKLLKIMTAYDLRDIHLMQPYQAAWDELQQLRKDRAIPDSTYRTVEDYLLYDIRKHKPLADKAFNRTLKRPTNLLNSLLPQKYVVDDVSRIVFGTLRRFGQLSGLGFRLRPGFRNLGQRLLLNDLYRTQDYAKAQAVAFRLADMPMVTHPQTLEQVPLMDLVREQDWYKTTLRKFEDIHNAVTGVERSAMYLYGRTHAGNLFLSNVEVSAITGYFDWLNMYNQSKPGTQHYKNCQRRSLKEKLPLNQLLTQEQDMLWNIREAVRRTQWEYFSISMPTFFRGNFNRAMGIFQSWWMNYFFNHSREMINQTLTGRNSLGRQLTPYGRLRALKGIGVIQGIARATESILGIEMLKYLFIPVPGYLPPIPELIAGILQYFAADDDKKKKAAKKRIKYGLKFWIPFSAFGRDLNKVLSGEWDVSDFLFYRKEQ